MKKMTIGELISILSQFDPDAVVELEAPNASAHAIRSAYLDGETVIVSTYEAPANEEIDLVEYDDFFNSLIEEFNESDFSEHLDSLYINGAR